MMPTTTKVIEGSQMKANEVIKSRKIRKEVDQEAQKPRKDTETPGYESSQPFIRMNKNPN